MLTYEKELIKQEYKNIAGVDEAGRGPLAGPVFVAIVIMPISDDKIIEGVNDSKKLTEKKRNELYEKIKNTAIAYKICKVDEEIIDEINILQATKLGIKNCISQINTKPDFVLVDYVANLVLDVPFNTIIKGDAKSYSIACASILAKVERDKYMLELAKKFPEYQFEKHKGYGTKLHYELLEKYGVSKVHRKSFLKNMENHFERNKINKN